MTRLIVEGRQTGHGAFTSIVSATVEVRKVEVSRTGNHWKEVADLGEGDTAEVADVSNTGKHGCYRVACVDGKLIVTYLVKDGICPLCD